MAKTIQQLLHYKQLIAVIQAIKGGVPGGILPPAMLNSTQNILGNTGSYRKVEATRQVAQAVHYGSASKNVNIQGVSETPVMLIHSFEHFDHEPNTVQQLLSTEDSVQNMGAEEVGRKIRDFGLRFANLRLAAWYSALTNGKIWLDGDGNLLASDSGAAITVDFGIPEGNKGQIDWNGEGPIIGTSWDDPGADISLQIASLQQAAAHQTGYKIVNAFYGQNIPSYLVNNLLMKEYLALHPASNQKVIEGGIPNGFLKLNWIPAQTALFADKDGAIKFFWGNDDIIFTPAIDDVGWWGLIEGTYPIPTDVGRIYGDASEALKSLENTHGMFSYATVSHDPTGIRQYGGDTFLPTINVPKAIYKATVKF